MVTLTRKITFSSGHRYWRNDLTESENRNLFGKWASPYNHGHNYTLFVSAKGQVDPSNGMVVNIKWIDDALKERVIEIFDQKSINDEVPYFSQRSSTVENLLLYFSRILNDLPGNVELTQLRLDETPLLYGEWTRKQNMVTITRIYEFAASHRLDVPELGDQENVRLFGKCNNPNGHGHNYVLEVTVSGEQNQQTGMIVDIGLLDDVCDKEVVSRYDHKNLDKDIPEFMGRNTTSEVVAQEIFNRLNGVVPGQLERVRLLETARNIFEVTRDSEPV